MSDQDSTSANSIIATVDEAIEEFKKGKFVIITDDEDRENEGDLAIAAEFVTPETINFMARYGRGLICIALADERVKQLQIPMMVNPSMASKRAREWPAPPRVQSTNSLGLLAAKVSMTSARRTAS